MYFTGFTGLRFLAATLVILSHAAISMDKLGVTYYNLEILHRGKSAVEFFFVLSGFLITYLLINEYEKTSTVSVKQFYFRRIKRIWPIYFLIVLIAFIFLGWILPFFFNIKYFNFPNLFSGALFYIFFIPNIAAVNYQVGFLYPLWSIGIEEQFYLFWAPFVKVFKKHLLGAVMFSLIAYYSFDLIFVKFVRSSIFLNIWGTMKFDCMLIGALFAILFARGWRINNVIFSNFISLFGILEISVGMLEQSNMNPYLVDVCSPVVYALLLISLQSNGVLLRKILELPWVKNLGMISYGMYVYHMLIDWLLRFAIVRFNQISEVRLFGYFGVLFFLTFIVAKFSWHYIEKPIIGWKLNKLGAGH